MQVTVFSSQWFVQAVNLFYRLRRLPVKTAALGGRRRSFDGVYQVIHVI